MLTAHPMAGPVATGGYGGPHAAAGASSKFSCRAGALSQWADEAVLGLYAGRPAQTLWTQASGHRARTAGSRRYASLSADGCVALGQSSCDRDLELSVDLGNLSCVRQAGVWL